TPQLPLYGLRPRDVDLDRRPGAVVDGSGARRPGAALLRLWPPRRDVGDALRAQPAPGACDPQRRHGLTGPGPRGDDVPAHRPLGHTLLFPLPGRRPAGGGPGPADDRRPDDHRPWRALPGGDPG